MCSLAIFDSLLADRLPRQRLVQLNFCDRSRNFRLPTSLNVLDQVEPNTCFSSVYGLNVEKSIKNCCACCITDQPSRASALKQALASNTVNLAAANIDSRPCVRRDFRTVQSRGSLNSRSKHPLKLFVCPSCLSPPFVMKILREPHGRVDSCLDPFITKGPPDAAVATFAHNLDSHMS